MEDIVFARSLWRSSAIICGSLIVAFGVGWYLAGQVSDAADRIYSAKDLLAKDASAAQVYATLEQVSREAVPIEAALRAIVPSPEGLLGFPRSVESVARALRIDAKVSFTGDPGSDPSGSVPFSLSAGAPSREALHGFLMGVEEGTSYVTVFDGFTVRKDATGKYQASITGRVFYSK